MQEVVMLLSAEADLLHAEREALEAGGFRVMVANGLGTAITQARDVAVALVVIDRSFTIFEQKAYAGTLQAVHPRMRVLCLDRSTRGTDVLWWIVTKL